MAQYRTDAKRRNEEEWLGDTEPYHGARPRATQFDRPVDEGLDATSGGLEENVQVRDTLVPRLQPEQQIRLEEEVQTPPRREPRRNEGHQPRGPRMNRCWVLGTWRTSGKIQLVGTDQTTNGHPWQHWRIQCLVCSEI